MSSNTVLNELPNGQTKTIDFSNQDKNSNMHASSSQTKQDPIDKSLTSLQEKNNPVQNHHENTLNRQSENQEQNSQKDQSDKTPSSPSKEDFQPSNTDSNTSFDVDGSKSGRNYIGHSKKQGSREYHSSWKSRNSVQQTKQPKNKRKDDVKPEPIPLQDLNSWPTLEQARSTETASKKTNESTTPKSPKAAPFIQSGEEKQDEGEILSPKKKGINWVPFKEALNPTGSSVLSSGSTSPPSTAPLSSQTSGNPREGRSGNNSANRGRGSRRRSDKDNSDEFYQRQSREGQQSQGGRNWRSGGQYRNSGNRGYSNRQFNNNSNVGGFPYLYTLEGEQLREAILYQIEYYYSVENLVRDVWLRSQWDEEGWLSLSVVASFPRIRALTTDLAALAEALKSSIILEYKDDKIRKLDDWKNWILPKTLIPQVDSPIASPKSNEQNVTVMNSASSENITSNNNLTETLESSQQSPNPTPASQTQPATRTYASLASADAQKQKQQNKPQQRKQEVPKKTATPHSQSLASQSSSTSQSQKQKSEPKSENKQEAKSELKKQDSASSTTSEPKKENTTENKPATEEGEWQTVEVKKRRSMQKVPSRGSKELPKKFEETNGVGDENHIVSPNAARKEKYTQ